MLHYYDVVCSYDYSDLGAKYRVWVYIYFMFDFDVKTLVPVEYATYDTNDKLLFTLNFPVRGWFLNAFRVDNKLKNIYLQYNASNNDFATWIESIYGKLNEDFVYFPSNELCYNPTSLSADVYSDIELSAGHHQFGNWVADLQVAYLWWKYYGDSPGAFASVRNFKLLWKRMREFSMANKNVNIATSKITVGSAEKYIDNAIPEVDSIVEVEDGVWWAGHFPETPNQYMGFYDGLSYYIPNGLTINARLTDAFRGSYLLILTPAVDRAGLYTLKKWTIPMHYCVAYEKQVPMPRYNIFTRKLYENPAVGANIYSHIETKESAVELGAKTNWMDVFDVVKGVK